MPYRHTATKEEIVEARKFCEEYRLKHDLSQIDMSNKVGGEPYRISDLERGRYALPKLVKAVLALKAKESANDDIPMRNY